MCTFAFVAQADGGYVVGHNRDESRLRGHGAPPFRWMSGGRAFVAPRDPDAGGTWIGVNELGVTMCVLNAAEPEGRMLPETPRSRGLVLSALLHLGSTAAVEDALGRELEQLRSVRSFQLVAVEPGEAARPARAIDVRWNGADLLAETLHPPAIRVSSTRHLVEATRTREASWLDLVGSAPILDAGTLGRWLASHEPARGPLSVCMHREEAKTVCRTLVEVGPKLRRMSYHDGSPCEAGFELTLEL